MNTKVKHITAINYYGGKSRHLDWILPLLNVEHDGYLEPFCGSASVLLNKPPAGIEVINDMDGRVINFFRTLREHPEELCSALLLTPYSRGEFIECYQVSEDPVENARQFFVRSMQSFNGICDTTYRKFSWRAACKESRYGKSIEVSKWFNKIVGLELVVDRLMGVVMDNRDAFTVIENYGKYTTYLMYCDPPYLQSVRNSHNPKDYIHEFTIADHYNLACHLRQVKSKVAVSHYDCTLYDNLYSGWAKHYGPVRKTNLGKKNQKQEIIYTNYNANQSSQIRIDYAV